MNKAEINKNFVEVDSRMWRTNQITVKRVKNFIECSPKTKIPPFLTYLKRPVTYL